MATLTDVPVTTTAWTNIHTTSSLAAGVAITIQNKTSNNILTFVASVAPTDSSGMIVKGDDFDFLDITPATGEYLFIKSVGGSSVIGVQQ